MDDERDAAIRAAAERSTRHDMNCRSCRVEFSRGCCTGRKLRHQLEAVVGPHGPGCALNFEQGGGCLMSPLCRQEMEAGAA